MKKLEQNIHKDLLGYYKYFYIALWFVGAICVPWLLFPLVFQAVILVSQWLGLHSRDALVSSKDLILPALISIIIGISIPLTYFKDRWKEYTGSKLRKISMVIFIVLPIVSVISLALFYQLFLDEHTKINIIEAELRQNVMYAEITSAESIVETINNKAKSYRDNYGIILHVETYSERVTVVLTSEKIINSIYYQSIISWFYETKALLFSQKIIEFIPKR